MHFDTKTIHTGKVSQDGTGAMVPAIYQTSTYSQNDFNHAQPYLYSRISNPTRTALESALATLENSKYALAFSSGQAATDAVLKLLAPGDEIICSANVYGGTFRALTRIFQPLGIVVTFCNLQNLSDLKASLNAKSKLIWIETPSNPTLQITDISAVVAVAKAARTLTVLDNTFATPFLQNPLEVAVDIALHSATKYLGGHSDAIIGALMLNDDDLYQKLSFIQNTTGAVPGPMDCFLTLRGLKTLHLRMERHCQNAFAIARWLEKHPKVRRVNYPGLPSHALHHIAQRQMRAFGGMVSFDFKNDRLETAESFVKSLRIFTLCESLGGVESMCAHPLTMSHGSVPKEEQKKMGISPSLLRLSVGVEHIDDLIADLQQAFAA